MPSVHRAVQVKLAESQLLADLYSCKIDLDAAETYCSHAMARRSATWTEFELVEAFVVAAIIKYGRCFTSGVRFKLKFDELPELDPSLACEHLYFIDLRNKFIAHSVNAYEETWVTANATAKDGVRQPITSLNSGHERVVLTWRDAERLHRLIVPVRVALQLKIDAENARLLQFIQALPLDVIHDGDLRSPSTIDARTVSRRRARLGKTRGKQ